MEGIAGAGAYLELSDGMSPPTYTTVFEDVEITGFGQKSDLIPMTHLLSTAKEFTTDIPEGVDMKVTCHYKPTAPSHVTLIANQAAHTLTGMRLVLPPGHGSKKFTFTGLIIGWEIPTIATSAPLDVEFGIKISGSILGPS